MPSPKRTVNLFNSVFLGKLCQGVSSLGQLVWVWTPVSQRPGSFLSAGSRPWSSWGPSCLLLGIEPWTAERHHLVQGGHGDPFSDPLVSHCVHRWRNNRLNWAQDLHRWCWPSCWLPGPLWHGRGLRGQQGRAPFSQGEAVRKLLASNSLASALWCLLQVQLLCQPSVAQQSPRGPWRI